MGAYRALLETTKMENIGSIVAMIIMAVIIALLTFLDLGLNLVSLIPFVGDAFETTTEVILETLQLGLTALIVALGIRMGVKS